MLEDEKRGTKLRGKRLHLSNDILHDASEIRSRLPELGLHPENSRQQISGIEITADQGIFLETLKSQRDQGRQAELLSNHDAEIFNRPYAQWFAPQRMARPHQRGGKVRLAPDLSLTFLKGLVSICIPANSIRSTMAPGHNKSPRVASSLAYCTSSSPIRVNLK